MIFIILSCFQKELPPAQPVVIAPKIERYTVHYSALYDIKSSNSIYDPRQLEKNSLERILFDPEIFSKKAEKAAMEIWTREYLLSFLGQRGSSIIMPPVSTALHPRNRCPTAGCYAADPTVAFRELYFEVREEELSLVVNFVASNEIAVEIRDSDEEESLCGESLKTTVDYVEFGGVIQQLSSASVLAIIHEATLLPSLEQSRLELDVFSPESDRASFCAQLIEAFHGHPALRPNSRRYGQAAKIVLENGLGTLFSLQEKLNQESPSPR